MWQIQWMISLMPQDLMIWIYGVITVVGLLAYFSAVLARYWPFKLVPVLGQFPMLSQLIGAVLIILGIFLLGGYYNNLAWQTKVDELETKLKLAEQQANDKNVEVQEKIVEKTRVIREKGRDIIKYVDVEVVKNQEVIKYIENCPVPKEIINIHNQAVDMNKGDKK